MEPPVIDCRTEYRCPKGVLYRAHPKYEDKAWYDHALVDWDDVALPMLEFFPLSTSTI